MPVIAPSPAAGYRYFTTGALKDVGLHGNVWSSSSAAAGRLQAGGLYFSDGSASPQDLVSRCYAFSVRCVQHLPGPLLPRRFDKLQQCQSAGFGFFEKAHVTRIFEPDYPGLRMRGGQRFGRFDGNIAVMAAENEELRH